MLQGALRRSRGQAYPTVPLAATTGGSNKDAQLWQVQTLCNLCPAPVSRSSWVLPGRPALLPDAAVHKDCLTQPSPSNWQAVHRTTKTSQAGASRSIPQQGP